ncbi:hypothetical protein EDD95_8106 [Streptomyces sp. CEV 2-1]|nr:hypothetical protein EDD95_8106 [Streptomyces sp. CEV 2-1]
MGWGKEAPRSGRDGLVLAVMGRLVPLISSERLAVVLGKPVSGIGNVLGLHGWRVRTGHEIG